MCLKLIADFFKFEYRKSMFNYSMRTAVASSATSPDSLLSRHPLPPMSKTSQSEWGDARREPGFSACGLRPLVEGPWALSWGSP